MLTPEQKEQRRQGIGGSDAAAIAGLSRYKTAVDVYLEKLGYQDSDIDNEAIYFGNILEPIVAEQYALRNAVKLAESERIVSKQLSFMFANVDRLIVDKNAVLECKTTSLYNADQWGEQGTDEIPTDYLLQCAHYRIVTNCDYIAIAVLIGGQTYRQYRYEKNTALEEQLIAVEHKFWHENVLPKREPEPTTYEDTLKIFKSPSCMSKPIDSEAQVFLKNYTEALKHIKELQNEAEVFKTKLARYLGNDTELINESGDLLASWKPRKISRFDIHALKKIHPELYKQFVKTTETREFRLKGAANYE